MVYVIDGIFSEEEINLFKKFVENQPVEHRPYSYAIDYSISFIIRNKLKQNFSIDRKWSTIKTLTWSFITVDDEPLDRHRDNGFEINSRYSVLIYLTDGFEGGELVFDDRVIKPQSNRTVIFDKNEYHSCMNVKNGERLWIGTEITVF
jgi:hypothetical protein